MFIFTFEDERYTSLGSFLKSRRLKKGLSQIDLAEKMGISQQSITYYESDQRIPSEKVTKVYAENLGLESNMLLQLRTRAVLEKEIKEDEMRPDAIVHTADGVSVLEFKIKETNPEYKTPNNSLSSIDGAPLTEEELEKAKEYIRALRIMKSQNTNND
ncbi:helix-turn-helix domain-containing protein [Lysinibacillus sp.]|uniref:helix-turn-helix domain-containing protein n=1 Tax=Lysinibacillus sp. TaxID=1869345 RepID=UPI0028A1C0A0|nr:helix-turn-helix domain-containing protein [Lysinibacillus sp.]